MHSRNANIYVYDAHASSRMLRRRCCSVSEANQYGTSTLLDNLCSQVYCTSVASPPDMLRTLCKHMNLVAQWWCVHAYTAYISATQKEKKIVSYPWTSQALQLPLHEHFTFHGQMICWFDMSVANKNLIKLVLSYASLSVGEKC